MALKSSHRRRQPHKQSEERKPAGLARSQLILFNSRKKWGLLYSLATLAGIFSVPGAISSMAAEPDFVRLIQQTALLPLISLFVATGMYILNDLVDADLDRANGKKRPIPTGQVSKGQASLFVILTSGVAVILSVMTFNSSSIVILVAMLAIGVMYSAPRIALRNRFVIKTVSISVFYVLCALLGITSSYGIALALENPVAPLYSMTLLGIMIFISSTLNDLGDLEGDRAAGRRTLPVVLGTSATIKLLMLLASGMVALSLIASTSIGLISVVASAGFTAMIVSKLRKIGQKLELMDMEAFRKLHKKIFPLHILLQLSLAAIISTL